MQTYNSGRPRVHVSQSEEQILAALVEYGEKGPQFPPNMRYTLERVSEDLLDELRLRRDGVPA